MRSVTKFYLTILLAVSAVAVIAQEDSKWKDLSSLKGYQRMSLSVDFSDAIVNYLSVDEFKAEEPDWEEGVRDMQRRLVGAFNALVFNSSNSLRLVTQGDAPITMTVRVLRLTSTHVSKRITSMLAVVIISDQRNNELFRKIVYVENGFCGTIMNLYGDVFERLGSDFGKKCIKFMR